MRNWRMFQFPRGERARGLSGGRTGRRRSFDGEREEGESLVERKREGRKEGRLRLSDYVREGRKEGRPMIEGETLKLPWEFRMGNQSAVVVVVVSGFGETTKRRMLFATIR